MSFADLLDMVKTGFFVFGNHLELEFSQQVTRTFECLPAYHQFVDLLRGSSGGEPGQFHQLAPADHAGLMLVPAGTRPVRLQTEPAFVPVAHQSVRHAARHPAGAP